MGTIDADALPPDWRAKALPLAGAAGGAASAGTAPGASAADSASLDLAERRRIEAVLLATRGNLARAARELGIDRSTLYVKLDHHGLGACVAATRKGEDGQ